jgi:hypothetical protein
MHSMQTLWAIGLAINPPQSAQGSNGSSPMRRQWPGTQSERWHQLMSNGQIIMASTSFRAPRNGVGADEPALSGNASSDSAKIVAAKTSANDPFHCRGMSECRNYRARETSRRAVYGRRVFAGRAFTVIGRGASELAVSAAAIGVCVSRMGLPMEREARIISTRASRVLTERHASSVSKGLPSPIQRAYPITV